MSFQSLPALKSLSALDFSSEAYMQAHLDFRENRTNQNTQILEALYNAIAPRRPLNRPFRIASIGAGTGIMDAPLMQRLAKDGAVEYLAIEPNAHELKDLEGRMGALDVDTLDVRTHCGLAEDYTADAPYDIVFGVHVNYYSADITDLVGSAKRLAGDMGRAIFVVSTDMPGNRLFVDTTDAVHGYRPKLSDGFGSLLRSLTINFETETIPAEITLHNFFESPESEENRLFMNFYLHADTSKLSSEDYTALVDEIKTLTEEKDGAHILPHNATLFVLK